MDDPPVDCLAFAAGLPLVAPSIAQPAITSVMGDAVTAATAPPTPRGANHNSPKSRRNPGADGLWSVQSGNIRTSILRRKP